LKVALISQVREGLRVRGLCRSQGLGTPVSRRRSTARFGVFRGQRLVGLWQVFTGIWLMYLTYGTVFNIALGRHWWA